MGRSVKKIRESGCGDRTRHDRILSLKCYDTVHEMVCAGYPLPAIANLIQGKMQECTDLDRSGMISAIWRYRQTLKDNGKLVHAIMPRVFIDAKRTFSNKMQELERLEDAVVMLQYRMDLAHAGERTSDTIDPGIDRMLREYTNVVARMHEIKMDLGLVSSRDIGTITVSAERLDEVRAKYGVKAAKAFSDPVSRNRVLAAINAIRKVSGDKSVERLATEMGAPNPDGDVIEADFVEKDGESVAKPVAKPVAKKTKKARSAKAKVKAPVVAEREAPREAIPDGLTPMKKKESVPPPSPASFHPPGPEKPKIKR